MGQNKVDLVRQALAELGDISDGDLLAFLERTHRVTIDPRFLPVLRATVRGLEHLEQARLAAREAVAEQADQKKPRRPVQPRPAETSAPGVAPGASLASPPCPNSSLPAPDPIRSRPT